MGQIACIGLLQNIRFYKNLGIVLYPIEKLEESLSLLKELARKDYKIIILTEDLLPYTDTVLAEYRRGPWPVFLLSPVPGEKMTEARFREIIKRAVGADVYQVK